MSDMDHLEIVTLSFARCKGEMIISPAERLRLILAAAEAYEPDLLVTAGHAVHSIADLYGLAGDYRELGCSGAVITEVLLDDPAAGEEHTHAMWAVRSDGSLYRFGAQAFARSSELADPGRRDLARFEAELPQRTLALPNWNVFALVCGELNIVQGRGDPRYRSTAARAAIMAADLVINPTHDRMSNAGTLDAKRRLLSAPSEDGRNRVYVSCSNWEACGNSKGRVQYPSETLHTVYAAGEPVRAEEHADGSFGFVYRHWTLDL